MKEAIALIIVMAMGAFAASASTVEGAFLDSQLNTVITPTLQYIDTNNSSDQDRGEELYLLVEKYQEATDPLVKQGLHIIIAKIVHHKKGFQQNNSLYSSFLSNY